MKLKDKMLLNSGVYKNDGCLMEDGYKGKEIDYMSRAYSSISNFVRDARYISEDICRQDMPMAVNPMIHGKPSLTPEEKKALKEKLKSFYLKKIDTMKEAIEEMFSTSEKEDEDDEESEVKVTVTGYNDGSERMY